MGADAGSLAADGFSPLVAGTRGGDGRLETLHEGVLSVVAGDGADVAAVGDSSRWFPLRSTSKPFQLLPFLLDGLDADLDPAEADADLAVMMASHGGAPIHTERVRALLERFELDAGELGCGAHPPYDAPTRERLARAGEAPSALHSNCSGKHTAMLAVCRRRGWPTRTYLDAEHPLQQRIRALVAGVAGVPEAQLVHSIDGCSLPTWWVPVRGLALAFARLAAPRHAPPIEGREAAPLLSRLYAAGTGHPELLAGEGRFDTALMRALGGAALVKGGAAGLVAAAIAPSPAYPTGLGVAVKIADGDPSGRVRALALLAALRALGVGGEAIDGVDDGAIENVRGTRVGALRAIFELGRR